MPIPPLDHTHVEEALQYLQGGGPHDFGEPTKYQLEHNGKHYPPKAVVGIAGWFATGEKLGPADFSGGNGPGQANTVLRDLGYVVVEMNPQPTEASDSRPIWLEWTHSNNDHGGEGWSFGTVLWSPTSDRAGRDRYAVMREPRGGDLVVHALDSVFTGQSIVAEKYEEVEEEPPQPGPWKGMAPYYRIRLRDYTDFRSPYPADQLFADHGQAIKEEINKTSPSRYPFMLYAGDTLRPVQGGYLTKLTPLLFKLVRRESEPRAKSGAPSEIPEVEDPTYWLIAAGEGGRLWPDFYDNGVIAIGWDELGELTAYNSKEEIRDKIRSIYQRDEEPTNDALACYQFSREIRPGDKTIIVRGRGEIVGYGTVMSDYAYDNTRSEYMNVREVKWEKRGSWSLEDRWLPGKTLTAKSEDDDLIQYLLLLMGEQKEVGRGTTAPLYTIDDALEDLFMDRQEFVQILHALERKKNVILQGPPGVGKTFIARRLAYSLIGYEEESAVKLVQFHQSYSYEDFVQGYRPTKSGTFELRDGVFLLFCEKAASDPSRNHVLIIDEVNRGNLSKIFGELLMLIEEDKREDRFAVPLAYSPDKPSFHVPGNLHIIGTMNTADRSLAIVDYALRRRFAFADLRPALAHPAFRSYLLKKGVDEDVVDHVIERVGALNRQIRDDHKNLGPGFEIGHSYFVPGKNVSNLDMSWFEMVVREDVEPLLREYWFDDPSKAESAVGALVN